MAKTYQINIASGKGSENVLNGSYGVTSNTNGYDNSSILPASVDVVQGTDTYDFTIAATGTLTLHVTEEGTSDGTSIVNATFYRCDSAGNTYGDIITTDADGNAVFNNVPFSATDAPIVYFKQISSDGEHEFSVDLNNTTLTEQTKTVEIQNAIPALRTINLTDANYANLPIDVATLTLS